MSLWLPNGCEMHIPKGYFDSDKYRLDEDNIDEFFESYGDEPEEGHSI